MSDIRTEGLGNVPEHPITVLPNRVDLAVVTELEKALGGPRRVAWLVEESQRPAADIMQYLQQTRAAGILCSAEKQSREMTAERIRTMLANGRHVVVLSGNPAQVPGHISHLPARLLTLFDGTGLPLLPVCVTMQREDGDPVFTNAAPYDTLLIRVMPAVRPSAATGVAVQSAWMEAAAEALQHHPLSEKASLGQALAQALLAHPNARLIDGVDDTTVTFRELLCWAIMFSNEVKKHTAHKRLGIILPPGKLCLIANLACWLSGVVPVNIDYNADAADFRRVTEAAGLTRFITEERFMTKQSSFAWPLRRDLIFIEKALREMGPARMKFNRFLLRLFPTARVLPHLHLPAPAPDEEATLQFTGGVCGTPKAAPLTHRMLLTNALQCRTRLQPRPGEAMLAVLPFASGYGLMAGMLLPLLSGCDIVTYPAADTPKRLCTLLQHYSVRLAALPPAVIRNLFRVAGKPVFASLRLLLCVGEKLPAELASRARNEFNLPLYEAYGLAETVSLAACNLPAVTAEVGTPYLPAAKPGTVGLPLPGVAVRITDPYRSDLVQSPDSYGLLWLKGPSVLHAYLGDEEATMSRMHGGWFCTGDIGRMDSEGMLTIAGRKTRFSKIGGDMVPHETLEQVLLKVLKVKPGDPVRRLAVVGIPDHAKGERLVLLTTLHKVVHPNDPITIRYGIMNEGYPSQWCPEMLIPVESVPVLPDGRLNYPLCLAVACKAAGIRPPQS